MRFQNTEYLCGPASLAAAAHCLGRRIGQQRIARLAGTTDAGTDEDGLRRAMLATGLVPEEHNQNLQLVAKNWLMVKLKLGYPVLLCLGKQQWNHWTACIGMVGSRFLLFDPARYAYLADSGVSVYTWHKLAARWYANKQTRGKHGAYYGIAVMPARVGE